MPGRCYVQPLGAHYLGEGCVLFNEMDADGAGALDASALDDSKFCQIAWTEDDDFDFDALNDLSDDCGDTLLKEIDNNGDGKVDFNEYMSWWSKLPVPEALTLTLTLTLTLALALTLTLTLTRWSKLPVPEAKVDSRESYVDII